MVEKWCESFETHSGGVPSMTMLWMLNLAARENGIRSDRLCDFARMSEFGGHTAVKSMWKSSGILRCVL